MSPKRSRRSHFYKMKVRQNHRIIGSQAADRAVVVQVAANVWNITCWEPGKTTHVVERCIDNIKEHAQHCDVWYEDKSDDDYVDHPLYDLNEDFCGECEICCHCYECDCPDEHLICKHIHQVHNIAEKVYKEQRPYDLEKTLTQVLDTLMNIKNRSGDDKDKFFEDLQAFVTTVEQKY